MKISLFNQAIGRMMSKGFLCVSFSEYQRTLHRYTKKSSDWFYSLLFANSIYSRRRRWRKCCLREWKYNSCDIQDIGIQITKTNFCPNDNLMCDGMHFTVIPYPIKFDTVINQLQLQVMQSITISVFFTHVGYRQEFRRTNQRRTILLFLIQPLITKEYFESSRVELKSQKYICF